ncbi:DUF4350 domain-containing protein [Pseudomonas sp. GV071]|jgi:hypothetical protein|uniref:DUF4350 domain-containing protein n=1 Tax=Pseudomonas sp. GV071 TaxID=2135754 RepID=UPI000D3CB729|nr:DUF4350 domain-containing protein [Pseudomonas sp. GV071]PTQ72343.1 uncharacterized protein DUF4350 [Pseudomonas sp. GV071]
MNRNLKFALGGVVVLLLGLIAIWVLSQLTPYQKEIKLGAAPEVAATPYLAAENFLKARGLDVQRADGLQVLGNLPSQGHTLLLLGSREQMTPRQTERVLAWAAKGGHLLVVAESLWDEDAGKSDDLLLDRLGIHQLLTEDLNEGTQAEDEPATSESAPAEQAADEDEASAEEIDHHPELTKLYLENEEAPAYVNFDTDYHLFDAKNQAQAWANSADSTHMLQLNYGDGLVTVVTDSWLWQNKGIAEYDNAWLLWYLTQDSKVTLLYRADRDDLLTLLVRNFPEALVALALLIALLLWANGRRQGPLLAPASLARRQLQEHLRGSADFLLRHSGGHSLLQALQRDIQRQARRRHPGFERLDIASQWQILGRLSRLPSSAISQAMRPLPKQRISATEFTRQVAHLQTLRNAL